jgi:hypothetical protein
MKHFLMISRPLRRWLLVNLTVNLRNKSFSSQLLVYSRFHSYYLHINSRHHHQNFSFFYYIAESVFVAAGEYLFCPDHNLPTIYIVYVAIPFAQAEYGDLLG